MKRHLFFLALLLMFATGMIHALDVTIQFANRRIFFPDEAVEIRVTVSNPDSQPRRFRLADRRLFTVDFDVRTLTNTAIPRSAQFTTRRGADQAVFFRDVVLEPGEELSFVEDLMDYVDIPGAGTFVVTGRLYPELWSRPESTPVSSNRLTLTIRPSPEGIPEIASRIAADTQEILVREALPPDEVVRGTIEARMRSDWNRVFLYMDLESILRRNPVRDRSFRLLSEEEQRQEVEEFRRALRADRIDEDIVLTPTEFEVVETRFTRTHATVITEQRFAFPTFTEIKEYTYRLERRNDVWVIYDYFVENLGAI